MDDMDHHSLPGPGLPLPRPPCALVDQQRILGSFKDARRSCVLFWNATAIDCLYGDFFLNTHTHTRSGISLTLSTLFVIVSEGTSTPFTIVFIVQKTVQLSVWCEEITEVTFGLFFTDHLIVPAVVNVDMR